MKKMINTAVLLLFMPCGAYAMSTQKTQDQETKTVAETVVKAAKITSPKPKKAITAIKLNNTAFSFKGACVMKSFANAQARKAYLTDGAAVFETKDLTIPQEIVIDAAQKNTNLKGSVLSLEALCYSCLHLYTKSEIKIDEKFQSLGLGSLLFKLTQKKLHGLGYKTMTWYPFSVDKQKKLEKFYINLGGKFRTGSAVEMECSTKESGI